MYTKVDIFTGDADSLETYEEGVFRLQLKRDGDEPNHDGDAGGQRAF